MLNVSGKRLKKEKRRKRIIALFGGVMTLFFCVILLLTIRNYSQTNRISFQLCELMLHQIAPILSEGSGLNYSEDSENIYDTQTESNLIYEKILARHVTEENARAAEVQSDQTNMEEAESDTQQTAALESENNVLLEKLNDFDYLIQKFYTVDNTTTITSSQLNAQNLLAKDCSIQKRSDEEPQILIYHTHASEGYSDSVAGDFSTTVVGVGEQLTRILEETYGYRVFHDTGVYDSERDRAYSVAAPYVKQILQEHPSIEVVIDLHRDGVGDSTRLVTRQNGVQMAQIMFFNGLSRTTSMGDITYLPNPYIEDNLAFSFQMQLAATQLYPGFSRKIYLKGYRYNMHFCPKSLLIEVGAQTNTLEEAMNAMEPLAEILDQVLRGNS